MKYQVSKSKIISLIVFCANIVLVYLAGKRFEARVSESFCPLVYSLWISVPICLFGLASIWFGGIVCGRKFYRGVPQSPRPSLDFCPACVGWVLLLVIFIVNLLMLLEVI
jgi:hypothetical protein